MLNGSLQLKREIDMKRAIFMVLFLVSCAESRGNDYQTAMDDYTANKVQAIIRTHVIPAAGEKPGEIIAAVSSAFLTTPYQENTLIGSTEVSEVLVADFHGVDCFTLIDYVRALSQAHDQKTFLSNLISTRYVGGRVSYLSRKHFFTDWSATQPLNATDVTRQLSAKAVTVVKQLNRKADGSTYIPGLPVIAREISYIPAHAIDSAVLDKLQTGDYVGVWTPLAGLDVTHVGIVIKSGGKVWFRNASSLKINRQVVDSPFTDYMASKPGIIVLRPH